MAVQSNERCKVCQRPSLGDHDAVASLRASFGSCLCESLEPLLRGFQTAVCPKTEVPLVAEDSA